MSLLPGVTVGRQLLLLGVVVLGMIFVPLYLQVRQSRTLVAVTGAELGGVAQAQQIVHLLHLTQQLRALTFSGSQVDGDLPDATRAKASEVNTALDTLVASLQVGEPRSAETLALATKARDAWRSLLAIPPVTAKWSVSLRRRIEETNASCLQVLDRILDESGLILDPQLDTYHLVSATLMSLPRLVDQVDQMHTDSALWHLDGSEPVGLRLELNRRVQRGRQSLAGVQEAFEKAIAAGPGLGETLQAPLSQVASRIGQLLAFAETALIAPPVKGIPRQDLPALHSQGLASAFDLAERSTRQLNSRLDMRMQAMRSTQYAQFLLLTLLVVAASGLGIYIAKGYRRGNVEGQRQAKLLELAEEIAHMGSAETDLMSEGITWSPGLYRLFGETASDTPARSDWLCTRVPVGEREFVQTISQGVTAESPCEFQHRIVTSDGSLRTVLHRGMVEVDAQGWPRRAITILQDITVQREAEQRIDLLANSCEITGLPNRSALLDTLDAKILQSSREERSIALLAIQIDQMGIVTDSMGYEGVDRLLIASADRFAAALPPRGVLAHLGGGEFVVLLGGDWRDPDMNEELASQVAKALCESLVPPMMLGATELHASCSIGLTLCPRDGDQPQKLLQQAQAALSRSSELGESQICIFDPMLHARAASRLAMEAALRHAVQRNEFSVCYQPQLDLLTGQVCGAEVLLRWTDPVRGVVPPVEFIPLAEETGLIVEIGDWVLRSACLQGVAWQKAGMKPLRLAVNLSVKQLQQPDITWRIQTILLETGMDPKFLGLEITESILVEESAHVVRVLGALRAIGIEISLDDFGTGYSNLSYLRKLPIDVVKIDRSIVHDVSAASHDVSMTRAVINMAHGLQMKVLAEGVETEGQLALLMANHCDQMQGYFFSPGIMAHDFFEMMMAEKRLPEHLFKRERKRSLLLVDDEENILAALKRLLRRDGYQIVTALSGAEGLLRLAEQEIDVIVSDQRMPGMTGVEFLRRAKELHPETVRMVLSGYTELQSITDAVNEGAIYKFLTKPWDDERLRGHIAEAFRSKEMVDENARLAGAVTLANQELAAVNSRLQHLLRTQTEKIDREELSLQRVREVLEHIPAAVIGLDPDGMIAYVNADADALFASQPALLGSNASQALPEALVEVWRGVDERQRRISLWGKEYNAACRAMRAQGSGADQRGKLLVLTRADSLVESE